jgi:hypothetical protein
MSQIRLDNGEHSTPPLQGLKKVGMEDLLELTKKSCELTIKSNPKVTQRTRGGAFPQLQEVGGGILHDTDLSLSIADDDDDPQHTSKYTPTNMKTERSRS